MQSKINTDLTIIIPAFNEQGSIKKLLINIINEINKNNFGEVEIIVVDDGSTDNTSKIVENFFTEIKIQSKLIIFKSNRGKSAALNEFFMLKRKYSNHNGCRFTR